MLSAAKIRVAPRSKMVAMVVVDAWMLFWFTVAAALCAAATVIPLRVGLKKMESFEF